MAVAVNDCLVEVAGGEVFVRHWQPDGATHAPIVLLHDSLGSVEQWRSFPATLAERTSRPVLAYDRLGFGQSSSRTTPADRGFIDDEARVHWPAIADALGLCRYVLFGHSVGGGMALVAASVAGNRCVAVITESAQAFVEERTLSGIREAMQSFADDRQFSRIVRWHGQSARWVLDAWTEVWLSPQFRAWSLDPYLAQVHCPVLAIHGESDEFGSGAFPRRIAEGVSGPARMEILDACGHTPHREREEEVLSLVSSFLAENEVP